MIPTINEAGSISKVIGEIPHNVVREIIVADGGSKDTTCQLARSAGAIVIIPAGRGYGRACAEGADTASPECQIIAFMDGDGADRGDLIEQLIRPIHEGSADFVIASRTRGVREPGSMSLHQVLSGYMAGFGIGMLYGQRYTDMCAFRAIRRDRLNELGMVEMTYGWNIEMQMKAARNGFRILEIPMPYRCRISGESKVAGSLRGSFKAGYRIIATFLRVAFASRNSDSVGA